MIDPTRSSPSPNQNTPSQPGALSTSSHIRSGHTAVPVNSHQAALIDPQGHIKHLHAIQDEPINYLNTPTATASNSHAVVEVLPVQSPSTASPHPIANTQDSMTPQSSIFRSMFSSLLGAEDIEAKLIIFRMLTSCIVMGALFLIGVLSSAHKVPYNALIFTIYGYLAFFILESAVRVQCKQRTLCSIREDLLGIIEAGSLLIFLTCVHYPSATSLTVVAVTSLLPPLLYFRLTQKLRVTKVQGVAVRLLYAAQATLVMSKLIEYIKWDWKLVLAGIWPILMVLALPMITICFCVLCSRIYKILRHLLNRDLSYSHYSKQCCLALWLLSYNILGCFIAAYIYGIGLNLQGKNSNTLLRLSSIIGLGLCSILLVTAKFMLSLLLRHSYLLNFTQIIESFVNEANAQSQTSVQTAKSFPAAFKTVTHNRYFIRNSGSYFIPLTVDALFKNTNKVQKKEKLNSPSQQQTTEETLIDLVSEDGFKSDRLPEPTEALTIMTLQKAGSAPTKTPIIAPTPAPTKAKNEELCYICCTNPQNAVMMNCGHSGICYRCAKMHVKKRKECMECRAEVEAIAVIEHETGLDGVFRSKQLARVVKC